MKKIFMQVAMNAWFLSALLPLIASAATVDLSPWKNPAGANLGVVPDILLSGPVQNGVPISVGIDIYNYGDSAIDTAVNPIDIRIFGNGINITTDADDSPTDTKTIMDGTVILPGNSINVSFLWTPLISNGTTLLYANVDSSISITESNESNNITSRDISFASVPLPPAVWLFVTGLLGLIGIPRGKSSD